MSSRKAIHEGTLLWRSTRNEDWKKVYVRLVFVSQRYSLRIFTSKTDLSLIDSITLSKELLININTIISEKERESITISNGKKELYLSEKSSVLREWINRINKYTLLTKSLVNSIDESSNGEMSDSPRVSPRGPPAPKYIPKPPDTLDFTGPPAPNYIPQPPISLEEFTVTPEAQENQHRALSPRSTSSPRKKASSPRTTSAGKIKSTKGSLTERNKRSYSTVGPREKKTKSKLLSASIQRTNRKSMGRSRAVSIGGEEENQAPTFLPRPPKIKLHGLGNSKVRVQQLTEDRGKLQARAEEYVSDEGTEDIPKYKSREFPDLVEISDFSESDDDEVPEINQSSDTDGRSDPEVKTTDGKPTAVTTPVPKETDIPSEKLEERRKLIAMEIYTTEKSYVDSLSFVIENYQKPLLSQAESFGESSVTVAQIFGNLEILYGFNRKLLEEIGKITSVWTSESMIGPMFKMMLPFLKMYTVYSNKYTAATQTLKGIMEGNERFRKEVNVIFSASGSGLDLGAFLIMPIQRIPRYSLLLRDLLKHTAEDHPDYPDLSDSLTKIGEVANHINEEVRRSENAQRFGEMQKKGIDLKALIAPHRYFIKDGLVKVQIEYLESKEPSKETTPKEQQFILFNDIFLHIKKSLVVAGADLNWQRYQWPLELVWVDDSEGETKVTGPTARLTFMDKEWTVTLKKAIMARIEFKNKTNKKKREECTDLLRVGNFSYQDGATYKGQWCQGHRHARGTYTDATATYKGQWRNDEREGKGYLYYPSGDVYFGYWSGGKPQGRGELLYADGTRFIGEWNSGSRNGFGELHYENGDVLLGEFKDDRPVEGTLSTVSGLTYEGFFQDNLFHGVGILKLPDGSVYEGEWKEGVKHGRGSMKYSPDREGGRCATYTGSWENDMCNGLGVFVDGHIRYKGHWLNERPHGQGLKVYADGTIYDGEWDNGFRSGKGKCSFPGGGYYEGDWHNDMPHGEGEYKDQRGLVYKGSWTHNIRQGRGKYIFPNGATYEGTVLHGWPQKFGVYYGAHGDFVEFYDGEWLNGMMHGKGTLKLQNGDKYQGSFGNNTYHGDGIYTTATGTVYDGKWEWGIPVGKISFSYPGGSLPNVAVMFNTLIISSQSSINVSPVLPLFSTMTHVLTSTRK